jgi:hypothetical protein
LKHQRLQRTSAVILVAVAVTAVGAGCSGNGTDGVSSESVIAEPEQLISSADLAKTPAGSPERAFLNYWSALQYSGWSAALASFEPALATAIGVPQLVEALKSGAPYFRSVKPTLRGRVRVGEQVIIRYRIKNPAGSVAPSSISWRKTPGGWRIYYDPSLDGLLQASAQAQVQGDIDPTAAQAAKRAVQAGLAASRTQSQYLGTQQSPR